MFEFCAEVTISRTHFATVNPDLRQPRPVKRYALKYNRLSLDDAERLKQATRLRVQMQCETDTVI